MKRTLTKETWVTGFALFSLFFGAGNLILPPFLGVHGGSSWNLVVLGFFLTAVLIPILAIFGHAKLQGTMFDFGKKVSPIFSTVYCIIMYLIAITLPAPRTASVTHEMAIKPYFETSSLLTSSIYFALVLLFVVNRSKIINLIGKYLTPIIGIILLTIICIGVFSASAGMEATTFELPLVSGLLEGYQTYDAIAGIVVGGVIVVSLNFKEDINFEDKKEILKKAGIIAGLGLLIIYAGLIYNGALFGTTFAEDALRTYILSSLSTKTLGAVGTTFLSFLVSLACFTTAVGIVTGISDYFKGLFNNSQLVYQITAVIGCVLGVILGSYSVAFIITVGLPVLMFIYPITIVLILLNILPEKYASPLVFKVVVLVTFIFSIPDFLKFLVNPESLVGVQKLIPLAQHNLGWVLPALVVFLITNLIKKKPV